MTDIIDSITPESRPIKWIVDGSSNGTIVIDNTFQRNFVWGEKDQISLIETILMGFPIPEIYLWQNDTDADTGDTVWSVVDGQQRTRSILRFINNEFKLDRKFVENQTATYTGKSFDELAPEAKKVIWKYPFSVRFISEKISKKQIIRIFLRLNRTNISLNPQELRNAEFSGAFIKLAARIADLPFWATYGVFNRADLRRMTDIQFVSTLLIFLRKGMTEETGQAALNKVYDQFNENYPEADADFAQAVKVLHVLTKISADNPHCAAVFKSKTQMYTLFALGYYLLATKQKNYVEIGAKLEEWYRHYNGTSRFRAKGKQALLDDFKTLSREGVQKKANRQKRFDLLKAYVFL